MFKINPCFNTKKVWGFHVKWANKCHAKLTILLNIFWGYTNGIQNNSYEQTIKKCTLCCEGGAAITCKNELEKINEENLDIVSS